MSKTAFRRPNALLSLSVSQRSGDILNDREDRNVDGLKEPPRGETQGNPTTLFRGIGPVEHLSPLRNEKQDLRRSGSNSVTFWTTDHSWTKDQVSVVEERHRTTPPSRFLEGPRAKYTRE